MSFFRTKSRRSYFLARRSVKASGAGRLGGLAALLLLGCPAKEDVARRSPDASGPTASAIASTAAHAYRTKDPGGTHWASVVVRVEMEHRRPMPVWPIPRMVQGQCQGADHVDYEGLSASADGGVNGAVVWLDDIHEGRPLVPASATQDEAKCAFTPHILALPAAGTLTLTNGDPANHAARFELGGDGALDFMKTIPGGGSIGLPISEDWAGKVARVICPIHLWMYGYVLFFAHPYFAVTKGGEARIEGIPPGTYHLAVWHEATTSTFDSSAKLAPPQTVQVEVAVGESDGKRAFVIADDGGIRAR
jgi:hypothetical protein